MGDLIRMSYSEVTATIELLDRLGVTPHDFEVLRKCPRWRQMTTARVLKMDSFLWALLRLADVLENAKFYEGDLDALGKDPEKLAKVLQIVRSDLVVSEPAKRWREVDGVIYLTVTLDKPTAGDEWIPRTEIKGNRAGYYAKSVLRSKNFEFSAAGMHEIVILKGSFFENNNRITQNIRVKAKEMNLQTPSADIACLIREQFTDKEIETMGLWWIVVMHEPIEDFVGYPGLLAAFRDDGGRWLNACRGYPGDRWYCEHGFAFLAPPA